MTRATDEKNMVPTYLGCMSTKHTEYRCADYSKLSKRFVIGLWCEPCREAKHAASI